MSKLVFSTTLFLLSALVIPVMAVEPKPYPDSVAGMVAQAKLDSIKAERCLQGHAKFWGIKNTFLVPKIVSSDDVTLITYLTNSKKETYIFDQWFGLACFVPYLFDETGQQVQFNVDGYDDFGPVHGQSRRGQFIEIRVGQTLKLYWNLSDWYDLQPNKTYQLRFNQLLPSSDPKFVFSKDEFTDTITFHTSGYIPPPKPPTADKIAEMQMRNSREQMNARKGTGDEEAKTQDDQQQEKTTQK